MSSRYPLKCFHLKQLPFSLVCFRVIAKKEKKSFPLPYKFSFWYSNYTHHIILNIYISIGLPWLVFAEMKRRRRWKEIHRDTLFTSIYIYPLLSNFSTEVFFSFPYDFHWDYVSFGWREWEGYKEGKEGGWVRRILFCGKKN